MEPLGSKGSCSASDCSDTTRDTAAVRDTGKVAVTAAGAARSGSGRSSPASPRVCVDDLTPHLRCGLCREPVAGSLVLSCGHLFCGQCLCDHLTSAAACPACQMSLRAIPVRCIAIDHVVGALLPSLAPAQQDAFRRRKERGESAPSIIAKMLWWLEAGAPAPGGAADPAAAAGRAPGGALLQQHGTHAPQHHSMAQQLATRTGSGSLGQPMAASARIAAASTAAQDAAMAAAMSAAAAAAVAASAAPAAPFGLPGQLGGMGLCGLGAGAGLSAAGLGAGMGLSAGLAGLAGANTSALAALGGAAGLLGPCLRDSPGLPGLGSVSADMAAYNAALSAMAMQSGIVPGQGAYAGSYPSLGGLLGM